MNRRHVLTLAAAWLALLGLAGYETHVVLRQDGQLGALRKRAAQLATESATLRREREAIAQDLAEAERQFAALPPLRAGDPNVSPERRTEMKAWLARVRQLRRLFDERPDQRIPEMQFLTDQDWLRVAKNIGFDSDDGTRRALAAVRDAAISHFASQLHAALRKFAKTAGVDASATIFALGPFFEKPVDATLLERYELRKAAPSGLRGNIEWSVQNKSPIDLDYDSRFSVRASDTGNSCMGSTYAPLAWIPDFRERLERASKDYAAAKNGASPKELADILPFFNPPLDPATAEKVVRADRRRNK